MDAPVNIGPATQIKTGEFRVGSFVVSGGTLLNGITEIGGTLDLKGNRISNVALPSVSGDVATKGFIDSETSNLQTRVSGSCPGGVIRVINPDGSVACE